MKKVEDHFQYPDSYEAAFLASMYSFYNKNDAIKFCEVANLKTPCDLRVLSTEEREVIASLLINYAGW